MTATSRAAPPRQRGSNLPRPAGGADVAPAALRLESARGGNLSAMSCHKLLDCTGTQTRPDGRSGGGLGGRLGPPNRKNVDRTCSAWTCWGRAPPPADHPWLAASGAKRDERALRRWARLECDK